MLNLLIVSNVLAWAGLLGLAFVTLALARQIGLLHERIAPLGALSTPKGPAVGAKAPSLQLTTLEGRPLTLGVSPGRRGTLLMFVSRGCPICKKLIPVAKAMATAEHLALVFAGDDDEAVQKVFVGEAGIEAYPFVNSLALGLAYEVDRLPHAVLLDAEGVVAARGLVNSREHLESLVVARETGFASVQDYLRVQAPVS